MKPSLGHPIEILLVEDSPSDIEMITEAFNQAKVATHLSTVEDGAQALDFLNHQDPYRKAPRPDLILLDLNLPRKDGREVLAEIKAHPRLKAIPVVVLTTSQAHEDVSRAYELQANCYLTKPVQFHQFTTLMHDLETFWLSVATLPRED